MESLPRREFGSFNEASFTSFDRDIDGLKYVLLGSMDDIDSQKFKSLGNRTQESLMSTLERVKITNIGLNMDKDVAKQKSDRVIPSDRQLDPKDVKYQ
ncbi:hypothetical protein E3Q00_00212 [Wallemia mellicola]|nr:hypothetical protein E3Q00_00212 [Wallemia mellicola]